MPAKDEVEAKAETDRRRYNWLRIWNKRYAHMKARVEGRCTNHSNAHGKELMSRDEFFAWCKDWQNLVDFITVYMQWAEEDFNPWLSPSVDRIDNRRGYVADNIQWLATGHNLEKNDQ